VKILLDENFPLQLYDRLRSGGYEVEHIIVLGQRGLPDSAIRKRVASEELLLLTQDAEFEDMPGNYHGIIIISRVRQSLPIQDRTAIWFGAIERFISQRPAGKLFDLLETGEIVAWDIRPSE
jgi:Domain of unknown function (DUF5615)